MSKDRYEIRADARRFENWETNCAGKIGLGVAIDYALEWGLEAIQARVGMLADSLRTGLSQIPQVKVQDLGVRRCGIVAFTVRNRDPQDIRRKLAEHKVNVSVSPAEYTRIDMDQRGLESVVRASVHYYNSEEEIARFCNLVTRLA